MRKIRGESYKTARMGDYFDGVKEGEDFERRQQERLVGFKQGPACPVSDRSSSSVPGETDTAAPSGVAE
eukprot:7417986-Karenia_brevis.AAC.1